LVFRNLSAEKRAGLFGVGWTTLAHLITVVIRMGSMLVLTRLLLPGSYGLFVAAFSAVMILNMVTDLGVRPGLMRHPRGMTDEFLGTGWIINFRRGLFITACLAALSLFLPLLNSKPPTGPLLLVLSIIPLIHSLQSPTYPVLYFHMRYRELSLIEIGQFFVGAVAGIVAALALRNEWALVIAMLANETAFVLLSHYYSPRPVRPRWNREAGHELRHFSSSVFVNTLVMALWLHSDRLVALNFVTEDDLGLFTTAWTLVEIVDRLLSRITDVYFSLLSRRTEEEGRSSMQRKVSEKMALLLMPLLAVGILLAPLAVRIMYPQAYQGAQILFGLMLARQMLRTLGAVQFQYFLVRGEVHLSTRCYLIAFAVQVAAFFPFIWYFGVVGMAWASIVSTGAYALAQGVILIRRGESAMMPYLLTLFWMAAGILGMNWLWDFGAVSPVPTSGGTE
jgi:O-antigen/teichoic acid export membrane protein